MDKKIYIIAELGNTHDGSFGIAKQMIRSAANCGVDAVKIQAHIFDEESLPDAPNPPYFKDESRKEYFERTAFTKKQYLDLINFSENECGVEFLSSPFSLKAALFIDSIGIKRFKIPSGEISNIPMLEAVAKIDKPVILSSGMSDWLEIDLAINTLIENGCKDVSILQCTSEYPCTSEKVGLNVLQDIKDKYRVPVGFSDHTIGFAAPFAAAALGASIIEKHFTLSTLMYGSDAKHSMEPDQFSEMVAGIRQIESMLCNPVNKDVVTNNISEMKYVFEKSVVTTVKIPKGSFIKKEMVDVKKPGSGIQAKYLKNIIGAVALSDLPANHIVQVDEIRGFVK